MGGEGKRIKPRISDADRLAAEAHTVSGLVEVFTNFRIDPGADRALRDLLQACRDNGTRAVIVWTPESSGFRAAYGHDAIATMNAYTAELTREFGVRVVNAREWLPDEQFQDGHHPILKGQRTFTKRLYREVLVPLVAKSH